MYEKQDVEGMLNSYLMCKAQLKELLARANKNIDLMQFNGKVHSESKEEAIRGMQLSAPVISDIPKSATNKISDTTANTAANYEREMNYTNKLDLGKLKREVEDALAKAPDLKDIVEKVERMLEALNREQRLVIEAYYFYEPKWDYVATTYFKVYQQTRTVNQLKNIRDRAIEKMMQVVNII